jgi:hypothetical protein
MKYLLTILLALTVSSAIFAATPEVNVSVNTNAAMLQTTFVTPFATTSTAWSAKNLAYGPIEIVSGTLAPLGGLLFGGIIGAAIPLGAMEKNKFLVLPYSTVAGAATGTAVGALASPVIILEGVVDTLTCGLFADRPFSWFKFSGSIVEVDETKFVESTEQE